MTTCCTDSSAAPQHGHDGLAACRLPGNLWALAFRSTDPARNLNCKQHPASTDEQRRYAATPLRAGTCSTDNVGIKLANNCIEVLFCILAVAAAIVRARNCFLM